MAKTEGLESPWFYKSEDWLVSSVTGFFPKETEDWWYCALSEEGDVLYTGDGHASEKIQGAGVNSGDSVGWGYLSDLQQIGNHLYACGFSGQVYRRWGENDWRHMDEGLLQDPATPMDDTIALSVINGPDENAIYAAGYRYSEWLPPKAYFYDGNGWREIALPEEAGRIVNMHIESAERIWLCGAKGTLLLGNAADGFKSLSSADDLQLFTSITQFQGQMYLASDMGLFMYDPAQPDAGIQKLSTPLKPDLQDANIVDVHEQVLWSIGPKDIACFDGQTWQRIHHPDNLRIGEV